ncbi:MAG: DUF748 domain-containing protein [Pseudomonadota bacterium]
MAIWNKGSKKAIFFIIFLTIVYALAGFLGLPVLTEKYLPDLASKELGRQVSFQNAAFNPFLLSCSLEGLDIKAKDKDNTFFSADKVYVRLGLSSIFRLAPVISQISVEKPVANITREKDGTFSFSDLMMSGSNDAMKTIPPIGSNNQMSIQAIPEFILKNVKISSGEVRFEDKLESVSHEMTDFSFILPYLSSKLDQRYEKAVMDIHFVLNQSKVDIYVQTTPFAEDLATRALIKTNDINVTHYLAYLPVPDDLNVKTVNVETDVEALFRKKKDTISLELQGKLDVLDLDLTDNLDMPIIGFKQLSLDILQSDVLSGRINLGNVALKTPVINISRDETGELNLLKLMEQSDSAVKPINGAKDKPMPALQLLLSAFDVEDATIVVKDLLNATPFETRISPTLVHFENVIIGESVKGSYSIALETESKEKIDSKGEFSVHPVMAKGTMNISDLLLNKYAPYYDQQANLKIENGKVSMTTDFDIEQTQEQINGVVKVSSFLIDSLVVLDRQSKEKMIDLPQIKVTDSLVDLGKHKVNTGSIKIEKGEIFLKRLKNGQFNLVNILQPGSNTKNNNQEARADQSPVLSESPVASIPEPTPPTWDATLPMFDLAGLQFHLKDITNQDPVDIELSNVIIKASDLMTMGDKKGDLSIQMDWNKNGRITLNGKVLPSKMLAAFDVNLDKIDIKSVQPYFTEAIKVVVTDGDVNTRGKLSLDMSDLSKPVIRFVGKSSVTRFVALDKLSAKDFFKAKSLYLSGLDICVFPIQVAAKDISLTDFYSRVSVSETGEVNLKSIFMNASAPDKLDPGKTDPNKTIKNNTEKKGSTSPPSNITPDIKVESVTLQGGEILFSDYLTQPNFTADMKELAGSVIGLSSKENTRAKLHLKGIHGQSSPLEIIGTINPLAQTKFADIDVSFKDIELSKFTPYAAKYLGYKIEKGKLILDLEYMINGQKLKSENRVRFDNFALGDSVDSKDATSLPVSLAIALLTNSDGQINLDLPVTGELDDPKFSFGAIIFKMIGNLILKVATSPFSIIGSMFGGGEELEYIDFEYGETNISPENLVKIDKLTQILEAKPSVKLEMQGIVNINLDAQKLRQKGFQDLIKAEKIKQMLAKGSKVTTLKDVTVSEEEMPIYIYLAYTKAQFPKPRNAAGGEKQIDVAEKKKLLITNIAVNKEDLRLLSIRRAENIKAYILSKNKIQKERIFILEPVHNQKDKNEKISRVKFILK